MCRWRADPHQRQRTEALQLSQPLSHFSGSQDSLLPSLETQQQSQLVRIYHICIPRYSPGKGKIAQIISLPAPCKNPHIHPSTQHL